MKNRLIIILARVSLPDDKPFWAAVAAYDNTFKADKHYDSIEGKGKLKLLWDMFYGVMIDRIDWDDMCCGSKLESLRLPFDSLMSSERGQIYVEVYKVIKEYIAGG